MSSPVSWRVPRRAMVEHEVTGADPDAVGVVVVAAVGEELVAE